jgi:hypothetical protein
MSSLIVAPALKRRAMTLAEHAPYGGVLVRGTQIGENQRET